MVTLNRTIDQHFEITPTGAAADPATQGFAEKTSFPTRRRFPVAIAFLVPAELPFQRSKALSYRDKMELKWFLMRRF